ncbi:hypothetical protein V8E36_007249 [Tilletia maclaganii]
MSTQPCVDYTSFGPGSTCRRFDFSLLFENTMLVMLPNLVFIALFFSIRLPQLVHKARVRCHMQHDEEKTGWAVALASRLRLPISRRVPTASQLSVLDRPLDPAQLPSQLDLLGLARIGSAILSVILAAALLGLAQTEIAGFSTEAESAVGGWSFTAAQALNLVTALMLVAAVWTERLHTRGGNFLLPLFLLASILFDGARLRTFNMLSIPPPDGAWSEHYLRSTSFFGVFAASLGVKVLLLATETANTDSGETSEGRATFFNRLGFFWLFPLMVTGFRKALTMEDLPRLDSSYSTEYLTATFTSAWDFSKESNLRRQGKPTRSLLFAIIRTFPFVVFKPVLAKAAVTAATLAQPYLISDVITFLESWTNSSPNAPDPLPPSWGWSLAGAFALTYTVNAVGSGLYYWSTAQNGANLRGVVVGQLYAKSLKLHLSEAGQLGSAGAVNLMSADVTRIVTAVDPLHEIWSGLITVAVGLFILYQQIGVIFVVPLVLTIVLLFGGPMLGKNLGLFQKEWSVRIEKRLAVTSSMINGMKAIKMAGLEGFFEKKLAGLRRWEMQGLQKYMTALSHVVYVTNVSQGLLTASTFGALAIVVHLRPNYAKPFDQNTVFTALSALSVIQMPIVMIGQRFGSLFAAYASFKRIEAFLLTEEKSTIVASPTQYSTAGNVSELEQEPAAHKLMAVPIVQLEQAALQWDTKGEAFLRDLTIDFNPGITMVIGPLSSGKSTLLSAALAEPYLTNGRLTTPATATERKPIAYSAQECWMQETLSIRANIVFHSDQPFDQEWYDAVVSACCLTHDFDVFAAGDQRLAKSLSGGQRQRISLARAVYAREADLVVLDDPFCALDAETEALIWSNLFDTQDGLLRGKTVILASNALHRLRDVDWIVRLGQGTVVQQGPPAQVNLSAEEIQDLETARKSAVKALKRAATGGGKGGDKLDDDEDDEEDEREEEAEDEKAQAREDKDGNDIDEVKQGKVKAEYYHFWMKCAGYFWCSVVVVTCVLATAGVFGMQAYLQKWTNLDPSTQRAQFGPLLGGLGAFLFFYVLTQAAELYTMFAVVPAKAGLQLHRRLLAGILSAPLPFFEGRSSGQVLNRFSQDLFAADNEWMMHFGNLLACGLGLLASIILMVISAPFLLIVVGALSVLVYLLRKYYLPNSRQLRRLDMSSKSPLYTLFGDSTTGLSVIRAFGRQETLTKLNTTYTDNSQRPYYALNACRRWLLVWSNACTMICNLALVLIVVELRSSHAASVIGIALAQTVNISFLLTAMIMAWCEAEIAGVVFERLYEFSTVPAEKSGRNPEAAEEKDASTAAGPGRSGEVELQDVVLSYTPGAGEPVLKGLTFRLAAGEHLGICGRTGSGKSTILLAILRMVERQSGDIRIGGRSIDSYTLQELRRSVAVVGQDPLIVYGASVRENLQLEGELAEDRIWQVLRDVQLAEYVKALPEGLDTVLDNTTARFSQGRRQLLTIARVLLNPKQVVVLDEISSSIDEDTDAIVQKLLRTELRSATVISIAHRIAAIMDYDRVIVLGGGEILEMDAPAALLARPEGTFRSLATHQGLLDLKDQALRLRLDGTARIV